MPFLVTELLVSSANADISLVSINMRVEMLFGLPTTYSTLFISRMAMSAGTLVTPILPVADGAVNGKPVPVL